MTSATTHTRTGSSSSIRFPWQRQEEELQLTVYMLCHIANNKDTSTSTAITAITGKTHRFLTRNQLSRVLYTISHLRRVTLTRVQCVFKRFPVSFCQQASDI